MSGENTKNGGLVIYEGTTPVTDDNVFDAKRDRNQYVWVPVDDFSKFVRQNFDQNDTISNSIASDYWEVILNTTTNMPDIQNSIVKSNYMTSETLQEVQNMYEKVRKKIKKCYRKYLKNGNLYVKINNERSYRYGKEKTHICGDITEIEAETFKDISGYEGLYQIGDKGTVIGFSRSNDKRYKNKQLLQQ